MCLCPCEQGRYHGQVAKQVRMHEVCLEQRWLSVDSVFARCMKMHLLQVEAHAGSSFTGATLRARSMLISDWLRPWSRM